MALKFFERFKQELRAVFYQRGVLGTDLPAGPLTPHSTRDHTTTQTEKWA